MSARRRRIADVGEHRWLRQLLATLARREGAARVLVGAGDDAAVLRAERRPWVVTTDAQRLGVHFHAGWWSWGDLGRRTFRVAASDVAAMGALPRAALLALAVPGECEAAALAAFVRGFAAEARGHAAALIGGDVSAAPRFGATATILGVAPGRIVTRAGARPGDAVFVTGRLGATAWGVRQRRAGRRARLPLPPVRFRAGTVLASLASAMIDVSDGLVQDLGHVCRASGVGAVIDLDRLPVVRPCAALGRRGRLLAATGGEDYELLFTVPATRAGQLARLRLGCACTRIGTIVRGRGVSLRDGAGHVVPTPAPGFDHFT